VVVDGLTLDHPGMAPPATIETSKPRPTPVNLATPAALFEVTTLYGPLSAPAVPGSLYALNPAVAFSASSQTRFPLAITSPEIASYYRSPSPSGMNVIWPAG